MIVTALNCPFKHEENLLQSVIYHYNRKKQILYTEHTEQLIFNSQLKVKYLLIMAFISILCLIQRKNRTLSNNMK